MKLIALLLFLTIGFSSSYAQLIIAEPPLPKEDQEVVITFDATLGNGGLAGYEGDVYAHTGVITNESNSGSDWKYVISGWGENIPKAKMERIGSDLYTLTIGPGIREYYGVPASETILEMAFVFRSDVAVGGAYLEGKTAQNGDIYYAVYEDGLVVSILQPQQRQFLAEVDDVIPVLAASIDADSTVLELNGNKVAYTTDASIAYDILVTDEGKYLLHALAYGGGEVSIDSLQFFVRGDVPVAERPQGIIDGVNYLEDDTSVILSLLAPHKDFVFVIGDFNNWALDESNYMKRTPDGERYWIQLDGLEPAKEYVYQYFIDAELRVADPYTHKVLDPWHDHWIPESTYPNLIPYPEGKTTGIVSVLQTAREPYAWEAENFEAPAIEDLVIYELLVRDFVESRDIKTLIDTLDYLERLGVNAIELMPINEFEGNDSWGYNPSFYFATDKAYGRAQDYKRFIDEAHKRGMAVILDVVLNHAYSQSPMVQMYFDPQAGQWGQPTAENPWFNETCPHEPWCWGYDFDHESPYTQYFVDRFNAFWLTEFKVDGFRFDFTKGFTNQQTGNQGADYDASRVAILKRMADEIWNVNENAYVILEHFAANNEEKELAEYGMMVWGNMNYNYNEATMGWTANSNFSGASYQQRGWNVPHLVAYMESHDEERLMFKNQQYGNSSNPSHDVKSLGIGLRRNATTAAFYFTIPGPKMIWQFGELGYDYSINHCPNGTIDENCRTSPKPVRWDYYNNWQRRLLYQYYSELIHLKKTYDVFRTDDYSMALNGSKKRIHLNDQEMSVTIIGNFDVQTGAINPNFQFAGTWHDHFNDVEVTVSDVNAEIELAPGEFRMYTSKKLDSPAFLSLGENQSKENTSVFVYPNPTSGPITLALALESPDHYQAHIRNVQGQTLAQIELGRLNSGFHSVPISAANELPAGLYFLVVSSSKDAFTKKLLIQ